MESERWRRVSELFEACLELPESERAAVLAQRCPGDAALQREVLELCAAAGLSGDALEPPTAGELQRATRPPGTEDLCGQLLGPYRLESVIGRGGMGAVYLASRVGSDFEQRVAIKLIRRGLDTDDILARFHNERQVLADLSHPGIARLLDGGASPDGRPYLVMEVVEGRPLDLHCRDLDIEDRLRIFMRVCAAVQHAHDHHVVHRDLKPSNILVTADGQPKLLDFGIAKLLDATGSVRTVDLTVTELRLMTPEYASPEQLRDGRVDARSDVYALGVILYELMCGQRPHRITTGLRSDLERAICEETPARPSRLVDGRRRRSRLSGDLDTIVLTALRKEPNRRYRSVAELAGDLERHLAGRPVLARPDTWHYRTTKFVRRNKLLVGSALAVFLALGAGLIGTYSMFLESESQRSEGLEREYVARLAAAANALRGLNGADAMRQLEAAPAELRGWEWRHLRARADSSERTLLGHGEGLRALAWSRDGLQLASGAHDGRVILWDVASGSEVRRWENLGGKVIGLELAPSGEQLLVTVEARHILLLDPGAGEPLWTRELDARLATFDPQGLRIAVASRGAVEVFSRETGAVEASLPIEVRPHKDLAFTPDGRRLLFALFDGSLVDWDLDGAGLREVVAENVALDHFDNLGAMCVSMNREHFVTGDSRGLLRTWSVRDGTPVAEIVSGSPITALALDPSGSYIASAHADRTLRLWDATTGAPTVVLFGHSLPMDVLSFSRDGRRFASGSRDESVKLWSADSVTQRRIQAERGWNMALALAPNGTQLSVGAWNEWKGVEAGVAVWDLVSEAPLWRSLHPIPPVIGNQANALSSTWSPDGSLIASCARDARVRLWDAGSGQALEEWELEGEIDQVELAFAPDSRHIFSAGLRPRVWDLEGRELGTFGVPGERTLAIAIAPGGELLAMGLDNGFSLWDVATRTRLWSVASLPRPKPAFRPGARELALGQHDGSIRLVGLADGQTLRVLERHLGQVLDLAYSPDGTRLVSASADTTLKLWDPERGRELLTLQGHSSAVAQVAFTSDGRRIVSQSRDGEIRIWDAPPPDALEQ